MSEKPLIKQDEMNRLLNALRKVSRVYTKMPDTEDIDSPEYEKWSQGSEQAFRQFFSSTFSGELGPLIRHNLANRFAAIEFNKIALSHQLSGRCADTKELSCIIRQNLWLALNEAGAMSFWVEGKKMTCNHVSLKGFLQEGQGAFGMIAKDNGMIADIQVPTSAAKVLMNRATVVSLLSNSIKNAHVHGRAGVVRISADELDDDRASLFIEDDGSGVSDSVAPPFHYGHSTVAGGMGLGMANADERMRAMGGELILHRHGGISGGARFELCFKRRR